jgi:hypothetical protein
MKINFFATVTSLVFFSSLAFAQEYTYKTFTGKNNCHGSLFYSEENSVIYLTVEFTKDGQQHSITAPEDRLKTKGNSLSYRSSKPWQMGESLEMKFENAYLTSVKINQYICRL